MIENKAIGSALLTVIEVIGPEKICVAPKRG